jgi:CheY-like chemotaxis protein
MVEDSSDDCELIGHRLTRGGYIPFVERVCCEKTMRKALEHVQWDIVLADHNVPGFFGTAALQLIREMGLRTPVLCITGSADRTLSNACSSWRSRVLNKNDLSTLVRGGHVNPVQTRVPRPRTEVVD